MSFRDNKVMRSPLPNRAVDNPAAHGESGILKSKGELMIVEADERSRPAFAFMEHEVNEARRLAFQAMSGTNFSLVIGVIGLLTALTVLLWH
ncbi:hypothetical protein JQ615_41880 [Bradyrhizobium jicamae]|uniref:Uncharacterized protein n=1 Tax=Bradyrhizobium jicamae TaxID=280332 RepID=A0ABS5FYT4_9BRAD|nr:hypothetical protein [Bradyrhizobium jicamae]MBR0801881.1 hypothetical protein [Bradyrhizobium jicamae]